MHFVYCALGSNVFVLTYAISVELFGWGCVCACVRACVHACVRTREFCQPDLLKSITTRWIAPQSSMQKLWLFFFFSFVYLHFVTVIYWKEALHRLYPRTRKDSVHSTVGCEDDICTGGGWQASSIRSIPLCDRIALKRGGRDTCGALGGGICSTF